MKIKESVKPLTKISAIKYGWLMRAMERKDALGRSGIDLLKDNHITIVTSDERADVGFSMHGDPVPGVPRNKCVFFKGEPPIYNIYYGRFLNSPKFLKQFLGVMSNSEVDVEYTHVLSPQDFYDGDIPYSTVYFDIPKDRFLSMVLRNKKWSSRLNSVHPTLRKFNKCGNLYERIKADYVFCKLLGPEKYYSFGLNGSWSKPCFRGPITSNLVGKKYNPLFTELSRYKFNFAPENSRFNGYVTEKPFQAMICGSIPIYLGAPDVKEYLPEGTYIDYSDKGPYMTCAIIQTMGRREIEHYRSRIKKFITSKEADIFSSYIFAKKLIKLIGDRL